MFSELNQSEMIRSTRCTLTQTYPPRHHPDPNFFSDKFGYDADHGGYDCMQPITTAAVAAILLLAGCTSQLSAPTNDTRASKLAATSSTTRSTTRTTSSPRTTQPSRTSTTAPAPAGTPTTVGDDAAAHALDDWFTVAPGPEEAAAALIDALQRGDTASLNQRVHDSYRAGITIWTQAAAAAAGGRIIDARVLTLAGSRATVAVAVAFPVAVDGTINDPVGYIVDLLDTPAGWLVTSMGFA